MIEKAHTTKEITPKREFHFAGSGKYAPMTIEAATREEAERIWLESRQPVEKPETKKVENINQQENN